MVSSLFKDGSVEAREAEYSHLQNYGAPSAGRPAPHTVLSPSDPEVEQNWGLREPDQADQWVVVIARDIDFPCQRYSERPLHALGRILADGQSQAHLW